MYTVKRVENHGLKALGLIWRLVLDGFDCELRTIGYFASYRHAALAAAALNAQAVVEVA